MDFLKLKLVVLNIGNVALFAFVFELLQRLIIDSSHIISNEVQVNLSHLQRSTDFS